MHSSWLIIYFIPIFRSKFIQLIWCLTNSLFPGIPLLYHYTTRNSSINCFLLSGDMYLSCSTCISSFCNSLECSTETFFEILVRLSAILLPMKSRVASAVLWIALFEAVFIVSVLDFLALSRCFWPYWLLKFLPVFLAKEKIDILLQIFHP